MNLCIRTGIDHRTEFFETRNGEEWERCLDCGEHVFVRYHDVGCGG